MITRADVTELLIKHPGLAFRIEYNVKTNIYKPLFFDIPNDETHPVAEFIMSHIRVLVPEVSEHIWNDLDFQHMLKRLMVIAKMRAHHE